ncbi:MAG TPA: sugar transferase [Candidatus Acidoferrum sp.]|jgi:exopolysaccharide biosynthesis polyprenyl glycosylphosphotransferase
MTAKAQSVPRPYFLATGVGIADQPASAETLPPDSSGAEWLNPGSMNGRGKGGRPAPHFVGGRWIQIAYALIDVCCVTLNGFLAFMLRFSPQELRRLFVTGHLINATQQPLSRYGGFLLLYVALILLFCQSQHLYRTPRSRSFSKEAFAVIKAVFFATLLLAAFIYLAGDHIVSRLIVATSLFLNIVALSAWRYAKFRIVIHRVEEGIGARNAVIVGAGRVGQALARQLESDKLLGYHFVGFLDGNCSNDPRVLGKIEDLPRVALAQFVDEVFITIPSQRELVKWIAFSARQNRLDVKVVPELYDGLGWAAPLRRIGDFPVMDLHWQPIPALGQAVKRVFDFALALVGLILSAPILAAAAIWIRCDSRGSVIYSALRVGRKGRKFCCYKLRTMVADADSHKDTLRCENERNGPFFKMEKDPRITRPGHWLRKFSVDELPQLVNVLRGDMSLVGPRPHPVDDFERYTPENLRRLDVKPGITGLWQVTARRDPSFETNMELDLEYIESWSLGLDAWILLKTVPAVFRADGA